HGLNIINGRVKLFDNTTKSVPHMGWNKTLKCKQGSAFSLSDDRVYYFVHSYAVPYTEDLAKWTLATTQYGDEVFVSIVQKDNIFCTQFHPEKSGYAGLRILRSFLEWNGVSDQSTILCDPVKVSSDYLTKRII